MKFSALSLLALPLMGSAQEDPLAEYKAQFQGYVDKFASYIPNPSSHNLADAVEAKIGEKKLDVLTIDTWKDTLYEPLASNEAVNWWLLITGGNKTCFGKCERVNTAYNETATKFALLPETEAPHMAYLNCDQQPVLCNIISAGPSTLWSFDLKRGQSEVDVYAKRLNISSITSDEIVALRDEANADKWTKMDNIFHPWNSWIAQNGLSLPVAYTLWFFSVVPNWAVMLLISLFSRRWMNNRLTPANGAGAAPAGGAAPRR